MLLDKKAATCCLKTIIQAPSRAIYCVLLGGWILVLRQQVAAFLSSSIASLTLNNITRLLRLQSRSTFLFPVMLQHRRLSSLVQIPTG